VSLVSITVICGTRCGGRPGTVTAPESTARYGAIGDLRWPWSAGRGVFAAHHTSGEESRPKPDFWPQEADVPADR